MKYPCWLSTLQDFCDPGKNTFSFSGFSCSAWTQTSGGKVELVACAFLAVELKLPIIESSKEEQKDYDAGQLGF